MSEAFVRGGVGEVHISSILSTDKAFWTRGEKEAAAKMYEEKHPGSLVVRDWWSPADLEGARKSRVVPAPHAPKMGMDPERAKKELRRVLANLDGLDPSHVEYDRLFANYTSSAHELQDCIGIPRTKFTKGVRAKKADEQIPEALQTKLNEYVKLAAKLRRKLLEGIDDASEAQFVRLVRDTETDASLQQLAVERLIVMGTV